MNQGYGGGWGPPGGGSQGGGMPPGGFGYGGGGYGGYGGGAPPGVPPYAGGPGNFPPPPGSNGAEPPGPKGPFTRLLLSILIAGVISGILGVVPLVNVANCCFCALNLAGISAGLAIHFGRNGSDRVSAGEGAGFGALAGVVSGLVMAAISSLWMKDNMREALSRTPNVKIDPETIETIQTMQFVVCPAISATFGALWGFLAIMLFFKSKKR